MVTSMPGCGRWAITLTVVGLALLDDPPEHASSQGAREEPLNGLAYE
jgi:hypothetical protein